MVDDEVNAREALSALLSDEGYATQSAADGEEALVHVSAWGPQVVLTDLKMPGLDGLGFIKAAKKTQPNIVFIVMTAFGAIDNAVEAIKAGAGHFLTKPLDMDAVLALVDRALQTSKLKHEAETLKERLEVRHQFSNILGDHPSMRGVLKRVTQVAKSRATILIFGESGTGKELIASAIHQNSNRAKAPFIKLNCAALSETLLESELFGYEKGAFTGAQARRLGRFEEASGGTLFLDEASEIPKPTQVKLLRFLQEREFERVGGNQTIKVDVRVVAATNRDLKQRVEEGTFREDLYYRLNVVEIEIPPLRARPSDIPVLAHHFLRIFAKENEREIEGLTESALKALVSHVWPGNVRELENAIERAVVLCEGARIDREHLPSLLSVNETHGLQSMIPGLTLAELERIAIVETLKAMDGSTAKAAEMLGISQRKIQYRLKVWGLDTEGSKSSEGS